MTEKALKAEVIIIRQPQGIAPKKNPMHGENNRRGRHCACPHEDKTLNL